MKISTKNLGIFSLSLLATASAVYIYSPVIGSHAAESQEAEVNLTVGSAIAISTSTDRIDLSANIGDFVHDSLNVDVTTNSQYGYTLTLEDSDNESSLTHTSSSISDKFTSAFEGAKTSSAMDNNTWGFSLDATDYYYVPIFGYPVALKRTTGVVSGNYDRTAVDFGAKVGVITAGTYVDTVKFTAYVNGADNNPEDGTAPNEPGAATVIDPCRTANYVSSNVLTDPRDGNTYTVKALKDGKCWMTQNLRLGSNGSIEISSLNSDLPANETYTIPTSNARNFTTTYNSSATYIDSRYGGYYNFYTATAGWGTDSVTSSDSPKSICPKGWRLPIGGGNGEFQALYMEYNSSALMRGEPGFVLSGYVSNRNAYINGTYGLFWSSTATSSSDSAFFLHLSSSIVNPTKTNNKLNGYAVRCVAR